MNIFKLNKVNFNFFCVTFRSLSISFPTFPLSLKNCCLMYGPTSVLCRIITNARIIKATPGCQATHKKDNESRMRVLTPGIPIWSGSERGVVGGNGVVRWFSGAST